LTKDSLSFIRSALNRTGRRRAHRSTKQFLQDMDSDRKKDSDR